MHQASHHRHHHHNRSARYVAWGLVAFALLVITAAAADFVYYASQSSECFVDNPDPLSGEARPRQAVESGDCFEMILHRDMHQRLDAVGVMLGILLLIGSGVSLSKAHRRTKRIALGLEAVALVLAVFYGLLWAYSVH